MPNQDRDEDDLHVPPAPTEEERRRDRKPEQAGIVPGEIPGRPTDPSDPRFPGSVPDLA
jgi:hypothetical protein